jgi:hypothetical protein
MRISIFVVAAALLAGCSTQFSRQIDAVEEILIANNMSPKSARSIAATADKKNVYSLGLENDSLRVLSDAIGELTQAKRFILNFNQIDSISEEIGKCTSLVRLELVGNKLKSLPESIGKLKNLEILELRGNQLERLPESIGDLQKLHKISLQRNNLKSLPESFGELPVSEIRLNENKLTSLPATFNKLQARIIFLMENDFRRFPFEELFPRKKDTYYRIGLKDNPLDLETVPECVRKHCVDWEIGAVDFARDQDSTPFICTEYVTEQALAECMR